MSSGAADLHSGSVFQIDGSDLQAGINQHHSLEPGTKEQTKAQSIGCEGPLCVGVVHLRSIWR